jgi:hypothetical protein
VGPPNEVIENEDFEQIFSFDMNESKIEELESALQLAKIELKMAQEKIQLWKDLYQDLKNTLMKTIEGTTYV